MEERNAIFHNSNTRIKRESGSQKA